MTAYLNEAQEMTGIGVAIQCPGCGSAHTTPAHTPLQDNVLCKTCGTCWHLASGSTERIDPHECPGCSWQRICIAAQGLTS